MIRVLQCVNDMHRAGLETMLMNYLRQMDRERIMFDFLTHRPEKSDYDDEIVELGGKVYYAPRLYPQNYPAYFRYMKTFFREHPEYQIVHSHIDAMSYLPLAAAKRAKIPVRIAHSHNTSIDPGIKYPLKMFFRYRLPSVATDYLACGQEAGSFLFPHREFLVIPNAIDISKFTFLPEIRDRVRKEMQLEDRYVLACVGRLTYQKNLSYLLQVFREVAKSCPEAVLLMIGGGEDEQALKKEAADYGLVEQIRFLGVRDDVDQLYHAMDLFVMPSRYEGLPVVGVEAQVSGLPCLFSSNITREVQISDQAHFLSIELPPEDWAACILRLKDQTPVRTLPAGSRRMDIKYAKDVLMEYYLRKWREINEQAADAGDFVRK